MKKDNHYFAWGLTAVAVVCAVMLIYDLVFRDSIVLAYTKKMISILAPILYGFAMAYLLAPIPAVGLKGIWWAVPIGWVLADLAGLVLYRRKPLPAETACAPEG